MERRREGVSCKEVIALVWYCVRKTRLAISLALRHDRGKGKEERKRRKDNRERDRKEEQTEEKKERGNVGVNKDRVSFRRTAILPAKGRCNQQ